MNTARKTYFYLEKVYYDLHISTWQVKPVLRCGFHKVIYDTAML